LKSCKSDFPKRLQTNYKNLILTSIYVHDDSNLENVGNCFAEITMKSRFVRPNDRLAEATGSREALTLKSIDRPSKGEPDKMPLSKKPSARSRSKHNTRFPRLCKPERFLVDTSIVQPFHLFIWCRDTSLHNDIRHGINSKRTVCVSAIISFELETLTHKKIKFSNK